MKKSKFMQIAEYYFNCEIKSSNASYNHGISSQLSLQDDANKAKEMLLDAIRRASDELCTE